MCAFLHQPKMHAVFQIGSCLPDGSAALCFLETQSHVYAACLGPDDKGIYVRMSHHSHYIHTFHCRQG